MRALQYDRFGEPPDVIAMRDVETPSPERGDVLVRVRLSPIHNHDLATIRGTYGVRPDLPAVGGTEVLGIVDGKRVAAMVHGAWAEYAVAAAATLIPLPDSVPDDIGAQLIAMPLSTLALFDDLRVSAGEWIVQNAANGAVGRTLVAVAQRNGVRVINLVRREEAAKQLRAIGAHHVVVQDGDWAAKVRELTGGAPIVRAIDSVCDEQSLALNRLLAPGGEHVVFGALARRAFALDPSALIFGETRVRGFWALAWMTRATPAQKADVIGRCVALAAAGDLPLAVAGVYPLEKAADALREAERPGHAGKVLLAP